MRFGLLRRRPGMSSREFSSHWANVHGPLVSGLPGFRRWTAAYSQNHPDADAALDGISVTVQTPREDYLGESFFREPDYRYARADERTFLDMATSSFILAVRRLVRHEPPDAAKLIVIASRTLPVLDNTAGLRLSTPIASLPGPQIAEAWYPSTTERARDAARLRRADPDATILPAREFVFFTATDGALDD
ncbi:MULTISPECIES: EthD domain-containing protein [Microbacterium]|uniref:EthD domain-containing protein n=1 Tax=Microbacterium saccharophilum TaxID=1213358 RepID=A0A7Z7D295_9MICO|nr:MULTISPECIES: EthD domain-containing protein [Microbacterium]SFI61230.1 EthD domain-containing protein [Microbacterium saccharophilum]